MLSWPKFQFILHSFYFLLSYYIIILKNKKIKLGYDNCPLFIIFMMQRHWKLLFFFLALCSKFIKKSRQGKKLLLFSKILKTLKVVNWHDIYWERVKSKKLVIWKATYLVNEKSKFFWKWSNCSRRPSHWWKIQWFFKSGLIVLNDLLVVEKYKDFSEVI